jgi:4-amino-4-deoxy-L-arabinose transferase-like glycosyltransferase
MPTTLATTIERAPGQAGAQSLRSHAAAPDKASAFPTASAPRPPWLGGRQAERSALAAILLLSAALRLVWLDREGYGNTYYAAAGWSMLQNWRAFLFAAFDAGGFVTVDKPPVGLWVQALSARLLGFSGPALLLPQALAGVASVALVWWLVRRTFGRWAGLAAAAVRAVTPITVVTARNNTMDSQLVLALLLAAWALSRAAESGRLRPLLLAAALVGLGFNIKMLQACPVVPAFALAYGLFAPLPRRTRLARLALAAGVLLLVSLSWSLVVDLIPARAPLCGLERLQLCAEPGARLQRAEPPHAGDRRARAGAQLPRGVP